MGGARLHPTSSALRVSVRTLQGNQRLMFVAERIHIINCLAINNEWCECVTVCVSVCVCVVTSTLCCIIHWAASENKNKNNEFRQIMIKYVFYYFKISLKNAQVF